MFGRLIPREMVFFDLFDKAAANVHDGAQALLDLCENYTDVPAKAQRIKDIEHKGDELTHEVINQLNKTFITPIDREDIHEITCRLDDILDLIDTAVNRMVLYKIEKPLEDARRLAQILVKATGIIQTVMTQMRHLKNTKEVMQSAIDIHAQENEADRVEQHALASLFSDGMGPVEIIKWKDIIEDLEQATDRCEDVANAIEAVVVKNA